MSVSTPLCIHGSKNGVLHHITLYTIPYHAPWSRELTGAPLISYAVSHSSGRQQRQPRPGPPPRPPSSYYAGQHLYHNNTSTGQHRCQPRDIKSEIKATFFIQGQRPRPGVCAGFLPEPRLRTRRRHWAWGAAGAHRAQVRTWTGDFHSSCVDTVDSMLAAGTRS